ncbi:MAG: glycine cleavage system protein H [Verrucomicrobiota bacterium]
METVRYKHQHFRARFPKDFRYSRSHYWMANVDPENGMWRVGFTKFATRMLGELVEAEFKVEIGSEVAPGQEIGWVEGFKAASDVFCVMTGAFQGMNPALAEDACIIRSSPYDEGYLYGVQGEPESESLDVNEYIEHLDSIINAMQKDPQYADYEDPEA